MTFSPRSIAITGASRGIGRALAHAYAADGVTLHLCARSAERLCSVATQCEALGATVHTAVVDVTDRAAVTVWAKGLETLDLMVANAGVSFGTEGLGLPEPLDLVERQMAVNFFGTVYAVDAALPALITAKGRVAVIASVQGVMRGAPQSPGYSASKAALVSYMRGLRALMEPEGIKIGLFMPGFVDTDMSRRYRGPRPLMMSAERAASTIVRGIAAGRAEHLFPVPLRLLSAALNALPPRFADAQMVRQPFGVDVDDTV